MFKPLSRFTFGDVCFWSPSIFSVAILFFALVTAYGQDNPNLENGSHPFGGYSGSAIDTVSLTSGGLSLDIPLFSIPQRGNLEAVVKIVNSRNHFVVNPNCDNSGDIRGGTCSPFWTGGFGGPAVTVDDGMPRAFPTSPQNSSGGGATGGDAPAPPSYPIACNQSEITSSCNPGVQPKIANPPPGSVHANDTKEGYVGWTAIQPDGSYHQLFPVTSSGYESIDGTGIYCSNCYGSESSYKINPIVYTRDGRFKDQGTGIVSDANGNTMGTTAGSLDSMGRPTPFQPANGDDGSGFSGCPKGTAGVTFQNYPGLNGGSKQLKICDGNVAISTNLGLRISITTFIHRLTHPSTSQI